MESALSPAHDAFYWCLRTSGEASVLVAVILVIQAGLRRRTPVRWLYCLWLVLVARLALPWAPESAVSVFNWTPRVEPSAILPSVTPRMTLPATPVDSPPAPAPQDDAPEAEAPATVSVDLAPHEESITRGAQTALHVAPAPDPAPRGWRLVDTLTLLWVIGAAAFGGNVVIDNYWFWQRLRGAERVRDRDLLRVLGECKRVLGVRKPVELAETEAVSSPALFGFLHPKLLLPAGIRSTLTLDELRFVLLHELAHVKRNDILVNWIVAVLQALHWFNPVIWFAFHRMRLDREVACDALALSRVGRHESRAYGHTIVRLLERASAARRLPGMAGALEDREHIKRRITQIARFKPYARRWSFVAVAALGVVSAVGLTDRVGAPALPIPPPPPEAERGAPTSSVPPLAAAPEARQEAIPRRLHARTTGRASFRRCSRLGPGVSGLVRSRGDPTCANPVGIAHCGRVRVARPRASRLCRTGSHTERGRGTARRGPPGRGPDRPKRIWNPPALLGWHSA